MAPESERADEQKFTDEFGEMGDMEYGDLYRECRRLFLENAKSKQPTLTCSEVVERLVKAEVLPDFEWNRTEATAILHSWRERRVQELEECLTEVLSSATPNQKEHPTMFAAWEKAEQIRKGAKHED